MAKQTNTVKPPAGGAPAIIIQKIETRPIQRTEQDIPKWRQAVQSAEATTPRRTLLYSLYADVVQDAHVIAVKGKRVDAATTANWQFVDKDGKPVDEVNDIIDSIGFDEVVSEIMESKFWGYSILEPKFYKNHDDKWECTANLIPRLHYRPEKGIVAFQTTGDDGINIREGIYTKTIMEVGKTTDLGLLVSAAQYAVLKRGGVGDWAMFVQVFGRPIVDATWDGFDEAQRIKLQQSLDIGPGGVIVRPEGTNVNLLNGSQGQSNTHGDFYGAMNREISKALLGTTETTESSDSSGYAQSKTHGDQDDAKHESDINFVRKVLNSRFTRVLQAHGIDTKGGRFIIQGDEVRLDKKESFELHKSLVVDLKLPVEDDFFYEEYGVPKPKNYDQIKEEQKANKPNDDLGTSYNDLGKKPKPKKASAAEDDDEPDDDVKLTWWQKLKLLFQTAPAVTTGATTGHHHTIELALEDDLNDRDFIKRVYDANGTLSFDFGLYSFTVNNLLKGFKKGWETDFVGLQWAPSFEYDQEDPGLLAAFEQNLFKFAGAKTLAQLERLNELFNNSKNFAEFYREAVNVVGTYNRDWLLTEYNTAVLVAQSVATYNRLMAQKDIFPYWEYKTAGDELVRHTHQLLEGVMLPADDPRWSKIYPPNGWNCRCYVVPRLPHEYDATKADEMNAKADAYINSPAFQRESKQGWGVNKAAVAEVFGSDQQYAHKVPGMSSKMLNDLTSKDFELPNTEVMTESATEVLPEFNESVKNWYDALEAIEAVKILRDFNQRPLAIDASNFFKIIAKKDDKGVLIKALQNTLSKPDEVWLNGLSLTEMVYVKYYQGNTFIAIANVKKGKVVLSDWMKISNTVEVIDKYRRGLLMFSNN